MPFVSRDEVLDQLRERTRRPARWATQGGSVGDFEGRDQTLELFDVTEDEQPDLFESLADFMREARALLGSTPRILFHTPEATSRYYAHVRLPVSRVQPSHVMTDPSRR